MRTARCSAPARRCCLPATARLVAGGRAARERGGGSRSPSPERAVWFGVRQFLCRFCFSLFFLLGAAQARRPRRPQEKQKTRNKSGKGIAALQTKPRLVTPAHEAPSMSKPPPPESTCPARAPSLAQLRLGRGAGALGMAGPARIQLIQGDNLPVLARPAARAWQVKCVCTDPPYNTGATFAHYADDAAHGDWLSSMAVRLRLLRNCSVPTASCSSRSTGASSPTSRRRSTRSSAGATGSTTSSGSGAGGSANPNVRLNATDFILWYAKSTDYAIEPGVDP